MAISSVQAQFPPAFGLTTESSFLSQLNQKVKDFVLSIWMAVTLSALFAGACFGAHVGLAVAFLSAVFVNLRDRWIESIRGYSKEVEEIMDHFHKREHSQLDYNIQVFEETLRAVQDGRRVCSEQHQQMLRSSHVFNNLAPLAEPVRRVETQFIIEPVTSFKMVSRLCQQGHRPLLLVDENVQATNLLNMANRYTKGGGVLHGANAQEETLCRQSDLYLALRQFPYPLPETGGVLVRGVQFFRDDRYNFVEPVIADVFTSAAYNCNLIGGDRPQDQEHYLAGTEAKIRTQLRAAILNQSRVLVLSAFGCGAFKNSPRVIAQIYRRILNEPEFQGVFDIVAFGIYDSPRAVRKNFPIFQDVFKQ